MVDRAILGCDYIRYTTPAKLGANTSNEKLFTHKPREYSVKSLKDGALDLHFNLKRRDNDERFLDADKIGLVNLGPIALFSDCEVSTSSGKESESIDYVHIVCLMHKLSTSGSGHPDLSIGFPSTIIKRSRECSTNEIFISEVLVWSL